MPAAIFCLFYFLLAPGFYQRTFLLYTVLKIPIFCFHLKEKNHLCSCGLRHQRKKDK